MTTASNWLLNWAIAYSTPYLVNPGAGNANLGSKVFFLWGGFCVICIAFVYFCIYETKGLSLEQVDELYAKVCSAPESNVPSRRRTQLMNVTVPTSVEVETLRAFRALHGSRGGRRGRGKTQHAGRVGAERRAAKEQCRCAGREGEVLNAHAWESWMGCRRKGEDKRDE